MQSNARKLFEQGAEDSEENDVDKEFQETPEI